MRTALDLRVFVMTIGTMVPSIAFATPVDDQTAPPSEVERPHLEC